MANGSANTVATVATRRLSSIAVHSSAENPSTGRIFQFEHARRATFLFEDRKSLLREGGLTFRRLQVADEGQRRVGILRRGGNGDGINDRRVRVVGKEVNNLNFRLGHGIGLIDDAE